MTKAYCVSGQTQQTRVEAILSPTVSWTDQCRRDAQRGSPSQTVGDLLWGSHKGTLGSSPFPPHWERAGLEGTQPLYLHKHVRDEYPRTSSILNKSVFFCLVGKYHYTITPSALLLTLPLNSFSQQPPSGNSEKSSRPKDNYAPTGVIRGEDRQLGSDHMEKQAGLRADILPRNPETNKLTSKL